MSLALRRAATPVMMLSLGSSFIAMIAGGPLWLIASFASGLVGAAAVAGGRSRTTGAWCLATSALGALVGALLPEGSPYTPTLLELIAAVCLAASVSTAVIHDASRPRDLDDP